MFKKALCLAIAVLMIASMAVIPAFAAETDEAAAGATVNSGTLTFRLSGVLKDAKAISFHLWHITPKKGVVAQGSAFDWASPKEVYNTKNADGTYSLDIAKMASSTTNPYFQDGLVVGERYAIIVYDMATKTQSYDLTLDTGCIGDTFYLTGKSIENPVDSKKTAYLAKWDNSYPRCHAVIQYGSTEDGSVGTLSDPEGLHSQYGIDCWRDGFTPDDYVNPADKTNSGNSSNSGNSGVPTTQIVTDPETGETKVVTVNNSSNGTTDTGAEQGIIFVTLALVITGVCVVMFTRKKSEK
jgi:hypothetical protein